MITRSTAQLEVEGGRISLLKTGHDRKHTHENTDIISKTGNYNVIPSRSPNTAGDAHSCASGFSGFQPELHSTPKSSVVDIQRVVISSSRGKPDLLDIVPNQVHSDYQTDNVKSEMIKGKYSNVSSSIENSCRNDSDKFVSLAKSPQKSREKQNNDMDYQTMTENVRKFAGSPRAFPESSRTGNMDNSTWENLLLDETKDNEKQSNRFKLSRSARGSVSSEKSSRLDSHTYQSYTAGLLHSTSRSEKFLNIQKNFAMLERISEIEDKSEKPCRPASMDPKTFKDMYDIASTSQQEELEELYYELEEAKRNKEFFSRIQSQTWDPRKDYSLLRKEKSVGDLKAVYAGLENDSFDSKPSLQKAKSVENTHSRGLSNANLNSSVLETERSINSPRAKSPREGRAIYGTNIQPVSNKYEIYVEKKRKEHKVQPKTEELHVRSVSVPVNESDNPKPLKRAHSSIGNKVIMEVDSKVPATHEGNNDSMHKGEGLQIKHGGRVIATYVNDSVIGENFVTPVSFKEKHVGSSSKFRTTDNEISAAKERTGIKYEDFSDQQKIDNSSSISIKKMPISDEEDYIKSGIKQDTKTIETMPFHRHFGEKCVLDERDKFPLRNVSLTESVKPRTLETGHYLQEPKPNTNLSQSPVQFKVRDLRNLAENNEFSDSKFVKVRPKSEILSPSDRFKSNVDNSDFIHEDNQNTFKMQYLPYDTGNESADDYVKLKKWKTSELCDNDGTNSENSSTDTFIVKGSEDEIEKEVDNLPDVTKGTKINPTQNDELLTEKSKSEPDLKQVSEEPRRPRSAKSHVKLDETSTENKFSSSFGMPRTVSGNLRDVFENYKKEGQFMRYKTPTNQGDNLHENVSSQNLRKSGSSRYDAYIPPNHIMKEVSRESDQYRRAEPLHKERTPSSASKMTVEYLDIIGNEWSQERNKQCIGNSPKHPAHGHGHGLIHSQSHGQVHSQGFGQVHSQGHEQGHTHDREFVDLCKDDHPLSNIRIKSASLGRHPKIKAFPEFYYHTWSPKSPKGYQNRPPVSRQGGPDRSHQHPHPTNQSYPGSYNTP